LVEVQRLMTGGDARANSIFESIGVYLGYAVAWYARWYDIDSLLILGRVTSGAGGDVIADRALVVLRDEFPELAERLSLATPDEKFKRHGQAIAAASLPSVEPAL
jgi:predicted NBD/HSP70 family sugar kinase